MKADLHVIEIQLVDTGTGALINAISFPIFCTLDMADKTFQSIREAYAYWGSNVTVIGTIDNMTY